MIVCNPTLPVLLCVAGVAGSGVFFGLDKSCSPNMDRVEEWWSSSKSLMSSSFCALFGVRACCLFSYFGGERSRLWKVSDSRPGCSRVEGEDWNRSADDRSLDVDSTAEGEMGICAEKECSLYSPDSLGKEFVVARLNRFDSSTGVSLSTDTCHSGETSTCTFVGPLFELRRDLLVDDGLPSSDNTASDRSCMKGVRGIAGVS